MARLRDFCRGRDLALGYALVVVAVTIALTSLPRSIHDDLVLRSSTNLDNLQHHPVTVLIVSAFVLGTPAELAQIPLLIWAYGAVQRWLGRAAAVITGIFGHVGATLFVAALLATGVARGVVNPAVGHLDDVGVSYGLAAIAGLCTVRLPRRWRTAYVCAWAVVLGSALLLSHTFTDLGHATAFGVGLGLAVVVAAAGRASRSGHPDAGDAGPDKPAIGSAGSADAQ